ncbi:MAG: protein kinase, partial [Rhodanobacteraceae bacterium]
MIEIPGYRLLRQLGRGGMATVYLAIQQSVDREVALKVMSPALLADPNFGARFLREAKIAARLHHRHVVGIHDVGRAGDYHYIAMEYLAGGPVLTKDGVSRPVPFALRVMREIATALNYAHEKGFIHRDVKPDNILLRDDRSAALTDFGIARASDSVSRMTKTGAVVGTPHYMSPEQARGKQIDGRCDIYSLGIVLYELLVGRVPYQAEDSLAVGIMHITEPVPVLPESAAALQPLIDKLLAKEPDDRFQTGNDAAAAIAAFEQRINAGELAALGLPQDVTGRTTADTFVSPVPFAPQGDGGGGANRSRVDPNLGRLDQIVAAVDDNVMRAKRPEQGRPRARGRRRGRRAVALTLVLLVVLVGAAAWHYQDRLRQLLPRTELNATLARAQSELVAGKLIGTDGTSASELFKQVQAEDADNDVARAGLRAVGQKLVERARAALARQDLGAARQALDAARDLLGGGPAIDSVEQDLKQTEARDTRTQAVLDQANTALAAGHILGPDGAAALYQHLLDADKGSALAKAGLEKCADALAEQARTALTANDLATATARAEDIGRILPTYPGLPDLHGQITNAREAQGTHVSDLVARAEHQLRAGNLVGGKDSARALFESAHQTDPGNRQAATGLRRVAEALVRQAETAIEDNHVDRARILLDQATPLAPDLPALRVAKTDLRELRERLAAAAAPAPV